MFEVWHLAAAYVVGSAAAVWLFHEWMQERIVTATLDTLIEQGYLLSFIDKDGVTQLNRWSDLGKTDMEILEDMSPEEIEAILEDLIEEERLRNDEDDTP
jgi:hypothetical protein